MTLSAGWRINESVLEDLLEEVPKEQKELERLLCNLDIRKYGSPSLCDISKDSSFLQGPIVLQITRFRNVSHPQISDHLTGGIVRLFLTDGHGSMSALFLEDIKGLNSNTPPGTKLLLTGKIPIEGNFLILTRNNVNVIGGKVEALIEKWIIEKNALKGVGRKSQTCAPMWVSFGSKKGNKEANSRNFKANDFINATGKKEQNEDDDFLKQRKENIESAVEDTTKKVFAAPKIAPPLNVPKPSEHVDKEKPLKPKVEKPKTGRRRKNSEDAEVPAEFARPSGPSTLFDFMTNRGILPASAPPPAPAPKEKFNARDGRGKSNRGGAPNDRFRNNQNNDQHRRNPESNGRQHFNQNPHSHRDHNKEGKNQNRQQEHNHQQKANNDGRQDRYPAPHSSNRPPRNQNQGFPREMAAPRPFDQGAFPGMDDTIVQKMSSMHIGPPLTFTRSKPYHDKQNKRPGFSKGMPVWKVGQQCKAPWTDGGYYSATIVSLGPADMCTVRYNEYGNMSTVPQAVLIF